MRPYPPLDQQVAAAKSGDEAALAAVIARFMPMIRSLASGAQRPGLEADDAVQEGLIGLFRAIESFDAAKGAAFPTYANTCVQNAIATASRAASRKKHAPLNQSVPLEDEAQSTPGPEELTIASEQVALVFDRARTRLSPFEKQVLGLYLEGWSYNDIASRLDKTAKSVENALGRIRRKLK